jgi:hypothetical protein
MSRLSIFAVAAVLSAITATPVAFAKEHHPIGKAPRYINFVRPNSSYGIPQWSYAAHWPPSHHDAPPSYNDPSKFGGSTALPVTR